MKTTFKSEKWNLFAQITILIFIAECTFGSSGRWLEIGPFSIRMVLFAISFIATLPAVFLKIKQLARNFQVIITVCFGIYLIICAVIGLNNGNSIKFIVADITSFMTLLLVPGFIAVMCNKKAISRAIDVVFWVSAVLAGITIIIHFALAFMSNDAVTALNVWINHRYLGGLATLQTGLQRIYMRSQMFLQVSIIYGVWKSGNCTGKKRIAVYLTQGIILFACVLSYTRGFWLGLAVSTCMLLLIGVKYWKQFIKVATVMLAMLVAFLGISWCCYRSPAAAVEIVNRFDPDLIVISGINSDIDELPSLEDISDQEKNDFAAVTLRAKTLFHLKERISQKPIFGNGLGENLDEIRKDGKTEYMYLDMTMKTGVVGTTLFVLTFFAFVIVQIQCSIKRKKLSFPQNCWEDAQIRNRFLTAAYLGIAATSFLNPFLNNPMGIMLLMLTVTAVYDEKQKSSEV